MTAAGMCRDCGDPCGRRGGRCRPCHQRFVTAEAHEGIPARFWASVDRRGPEECWPWTGGLDGGGYGRFAIDQTLFKAHRVAYGLVVGLIPAGLTLDHLCRNRACVNPRHLEPVTSAENVRRTRKATCVRGHSAWVERRDGRSRRCGECQSERNRAMRVAA